MNIQEYIENRLESQRDWYEKKANKNKVSFMNYQKIIIVLGAFIPVNVIFFQLIPEDYQQYEGLVNALVSCVIAIVAGLDKLSQPQTNWYNYRANEEVLKKERHLFEFKAGPYREVNDEVEMKKLLVERVESIISADISRFVQSQKSKDEHLSSSEDDDENHLNEASENNAKKKPEK